MEGWSDLFVASAGAAAALAGLVFVAVSINVERIIDYPGLPERGISTVMLLLGVVIVALIGLLPGQSTTALGIELLLESVLLLGALVTLTIARRPKAGEESHLGSALFVILLGTVPFVVGAAIVVSGDLDGLYWTFAGIVGALLGGVLNAWVLLVEILR